MGSSRGDIIACRVFKQAKSIRVDVQFAHSSLLSELVLHLWKNVESNGHSLPSIRMMPESSKQA